MGPGQEKVGESTSPAPIPSVETPAPKPSAETLAPREAVEGDRDDEDDYEEFKDKDGSRPVAQALPKNIVGKKKDGSEGQESSAIAPASKRKPEPKPRKGRSPGPRPPAPPGTLPFIGPGTVVWGDWEKRGPANGRYYYYNVKLKTSQ